MMWLRPHYAFVFVSRAFLGTFVLVSLTRISKVSKIALIFYWLIQEQASFLEW